MDRGGLRYESRLQTLEARISIGGRDILTAFASNLDGKATDQSERSVRDICLLSMVALYGGANNVCALTQDETGWTLTASVPKATADCQALCFDLVGEGT